LILSGSYTGRVHGIFRPLNLVWRGKVFKGEQAKNRICGGLLVEGEVKTYGNYLAFIVYRQWGLTDVLKRRLDGDGTTWDGWMRLGWLVVHFTLTKDR
jgi:hypothetical protein